MRNTVREAGGDNARPEAQDGYGNPDSSDAESRFSALLTPNRSLVPKGFLILMAGVGVVSFAAGMAFILAGAWPVFGFFMLDVLLVYWAFRLNYRSGKLYETVDLTADTLTVTRVLPSGRSRSWAFNPYWARCEVPEGPRNTTELSLASHGDRLVFGAFLTAAEKRDFAGALSGALRRSRGRTRI